MAKRKKYDDDDGRVIANMNVDGMPWYVEPIDDNAPKRREDGTTEEREQEPLTRGETWQVMWGSLKAAFAFAGILAVGTVLFVLFCTNVWLT